MGEGVCLDCEIRGEVTCILRGFSRVSIVAAGYFLGCEMTGACRVCDELHNLEDVL